MANDADTKPLGPPRVRDSTFREVYSNASFTGLSPFDITLIFSKTSDMGGQLVNLDQVAVTLSPQHFKAFARSIQQTMEAYEQAFGVLAIPEKLTAPGISVADLAQKISDAQKGSGISPSSSAKKLPSKRSRGGAQH